MTSAFSPLAIRAKLTLTGVFSGTGDHHEAIALADGRRRRLADDMHVAAQMHESHRRHLSRQTRTAKARKEPLTRFVVKGLHDPEEGLSVHPLEEIGYFLSHGHPRPGLVNLPRIHFAASWGCSDPVMALPMIRISGSTASTASMVSGPIPPASATRKPR